MKLRFAPQAQAMSLPSAAFEDVELQCRGPEHNVS
jgi:hypothetical protein